MQKTARKNTKYSRNVTILKIGHLAKAILLRPLENGQFRSKIKNARNVRKTIIQDYKSCFVQKTARKNTKYARNETILKNQSSCKDYSAGKGCSLCRMVNLGQKLKMLEICEKPSYKIRRVLLCKKPLEKAPNMRETRQF